MRGGPDVGISGLCGFEITPVTALNLFLHVIYTRDVQIIFIFLTFLCEKVEIKKKRRVLKLTSDQPLYFWQHHKTASV